MFHVDLLIFQVRAPLLLHQFTNSMPASALTRFVVGNAVLVASTHGVSLRDAANKNNVLEYGSCHIRKRKHTNSSEVKSH